MKYHEHFINREAHFFGGKLHGESTGLTIEEAIPLLEIEGYQAVALQHLVETEERKDKFVYLAYAEDKDKNLSEIIADFHAILVDNLQK